MPQLPTYSSKASLTTQQPEVTRTGASETATAVAGVLDTAQDVRQKWLTAKNTIDATVAKANYEYGVKDIGLKAANDPDSSNIKLYEAELNAKKDECLKIIKDETTRDRVAFEMEHGNKMAMLDITNDFRKKDISAGKVSTLRLLELEKGNYRNAKDDLGRVVSHTKMKNIVEEQVAGGLYSREEGNKLLEDTIKSAQDSLKDIEAIRRAEEKELIMAQEEAVNDTEHGYMVMRYQGTDANGVPISREELLVNARRDVEAKAISEKFYEAYRIALTVPEAVGALQTDKDFSEILTMINEGYRADTEIRDRILKKLSARYLSNQDAEYLTKYMDVLKGKNPEDVIRATWKGVERITDTTTERTASRQRIAKDWVDELLAGIEPSAAAVSAIRKEVLFLHPDAPRYPEGKPVMDSKKVRKRIMPNGDVVDEPTASAKPSSPKKEPERELRLYKKAPKKE